MEIWIAKFLGPIIFISAIPMIFAPKSINQLSQGFLEDKPLMFISGVLAMIGGLSIINSYNVWNIDWTLIITLFGWALTISGASRIVMPHFVTKIGGSTIERPKVTVFAGIIWLALGSFLTLKGYA